MNSDKKNKNHFLGARPFSAIRRAFGLVCSLWKLQSGAAIANDSMDETLLTRLMKTIRLKRASIRLAARRRDNCHSPHIVELLETRALLAADLPPLLDINATTDAHTYPDRIVEVNGISYFSATASTTGKELWKSDGTASGTVLVKDIFPGIGSSNPDKLTNVNGTLFL